ncbi:MAG: Gfo/Idh/MocA family oxidoreductase, partial [Spirochaetales bacterium]|nr:Gfo/Idh/MocA family oxidoreductase [Spirochaetales bacterium]
MVGKRYAIVGLGGRSSMYVEALADAFKKHGELCAFCDINTTRMAFYNKKLQEDHQIAPLPAYTPDRFEAMISEQNIDTVIVTSVDRTHHRYIIRAMEAGCDAITEKPMTVDADKCNAILDTIKRTGKSLRVTFNYRYAPRSSKVKELLMQGVIGDIKSVHFEWLLNTKHGADYFRRWHRDKRNSGGLMVHKATHHFDLINWFLESRPKRVFGFGNLSFYGRENAEERGIQKFYDRGTTHPNAADDPFAINLSEDERLNALYYEAESKDGYRRDQSVFGDGISIEDDMAVLVEYESGATMSYHLTAYSPWEGFRIALNGTEGRLEYDVQENAYVSGTESDHNQPDIRDAKDINLNEPLRILVRPLWGKPMEVTVDETGEGG